MTSLLTFIAVRLRAIADTNYFPLLDSLTSFSEKQREVLRNKRRKGERTKSQIMFRLGIFQVGSVQKFFLQLRPKIDLAKNFFLHYLCRKLCKKKISTRIES